MSLVLTGSSTSTISMSGIMLGTKFTIEMWIRVSTRPSGTTETLLHLSAADDTSLIKLSVSGVDQNTFRLRNKLTSLSSGPALNYNEWYNITLVGVVNSPSYVVYAYINGIFNNGLGTSESGFIGFLYNNVKMSITPGSSTVNIYNFKMIKDWLIVPGDNFTPSVLFPSNLDSYLIVLCAGIKDNIIVGGDRVASGNYQPMALGTVSNTVSFNNITVTADEMPPAAALPQVHATICFVAGTPVLTDNSGYVPIDELTPGTHTIDGQHILAVTQTITPDLYLVAIDKDAMSEGVPSENTIMSINHKILTDNGEMTEAGKLVPEMARLIPYNQEVLYNVVLQNHGTMTVNNMTVETLDPENLVAKMFVAMKGMNQEQREIIVKLYNEYVKTIVVKHKRGGEQTKK